MDSDILEKLEEKFSGFPARKYNKGQVLVYGGDTINHIYYLTKGLVRQYDITYRGDEIVLNQYREGAFFPISNVISKKPSKYFYRAEDDVELKLIPADEALDFLKSNPDVMYELLSRVFRGTDVLLDRMSQLMGGTAKSIIIFELVNEVKRYDTFTSKIELNLKEHDIAARTGLSRETVSRELKGLKDAGIVSVSHSGITVLDHTKLSELIST